jgi:hypothetical protein
LSEKLKELSQAYDEAKNCGFNGSFLDYLKSLDVRLIDLEEESPEIEKEKKLKKARKKWSLRGIFKI